MTTLVADLGLFPATSVYGTLTANTVAVEDLTEDYPAVLVVNEDDTSWIYVIVDPEEGQHPGVRADGSLPVPPSTAVPFRSKGNGATVVELKSPGTPNYCLVPLTDR